MTWPFCLGNFQKAFVLFMFLTTFLKKIGLVDEARVPRGGREKCEWIFLEIRRESEWEILEGRQEKKKPKVINNSWKKREEEKKHLETLTIINN